MKKYTIYSNEIIDQYIKSVIMGLNIEYHYSGFKIRLRAFTHHIVQEHKLHSNLIAKHKHKNAL